jgi:hypothetical protein
MRNHPQAAVIKTIGVICLTTAGFCVVLVSTTVANDGAALGAAFLGLLTMFIGGGIALAND